MDSSDSTLTETSSIATEQPQTETFTPQFDIEVGKVVVEDKHANEEMIQWKAITSDGIECVSNSPMDAVMGAVEEQTGGVV
jgi:hypothetical protein